MSAIEHELCHCIFLFFRLQRLLRVSGQHVVPVEGSGREYLIGAVFRDFCCGSLRPFVVIHDLCERCSHAARHGLLIICSKALQVVRFVLSPYCLNQRFDDLLGLYRSGSTAGSRCPVQSVLASVFDFLLVAVEQLLHVHGDVLRIDGAGVRVAQDLLCGIITRDDDESALLVVVENVVVGILGSRPSSLRGMSTHTLKSQFQSVGLSHAPLGHERLGRPHGRLPADRVGLRSGCNEQHDKHHQKLSHNFQFRINAVQSYKECTNNTPFSSEKLTKRVGNGGGYVLDAFLHRIDGEGTLHNSMKFGDELFLQMSLKIYNFAFQN